MKRSIAGFTANLDSDTQGMALIDAAQPMLTALRKLTHSKTIETLALVHKKRGKQYTKKGRHWPPLCTDSR